MIAVGVKLPLPVVERLDQFVALREYPSRSAAILRGVEVLLSQYRPRVIKGPTQRAIDLEKELKRLLRRAEAEREIIKGVRR